MTTGQNRNAMIASLMRKAVERAERKRRSQQAIDRILQRRSQAPVIDDATLRRLRDEGRP